MTWTNRTLRRDQPGPVVRIRSYTGLLISPLTAQPLGNEPPSSREQVGGWEQDPHADCDEEGKRGGREPSLCTNSCVAHMGLLCSFGLPEPSDTQTHSSRL